MSTIYGFSIQSLLTYDNGDCNGPYSAVKFADEAIGSRGLRYNRLARISFLDTDMLQETDGEEGPSNYDHLIIGNESADELMLTLWVDMGSIGLMVAIAFASDRQLRIPDAYRDYPFIARPSDAELNDIFDSLFENKNVLGIEGSRPNKAA